MDEVEYLDTTLVLGCNLYTYCLNNPIVNIDNSGNLSFWGVLFVAVGLTIVFVLLGLFVLAVFELIAFFKATENESHINETISLTKDTEIKNTYTFFYKGENFATTWNVDTSTWKIIDSYKIKNRKDILKICQALVEINPVPLGNGEVGYRTPEDMTYEWIQHNIGYEMCIMLGFTSLEDPGYSNCKDVDINPGDQGKNINQLILERLKNA